MNTESVDCRRIKVPVEEGHQIKPGDFGWSFDWAGSENDPNSPLYIYICLPGESPHLSAIEVKRGAPGGHRVWGWDGDEDRPTLTPSILTPDIWHGHLVKGRLISC